MRRSLILGLLTVTILSCEDDEKKDRAIQLNGEDSYVYLGNIYDDLELPVTISAWIKVQAIEQYAPIFVSQDNLPGYTGFMFMATPSGISIQYGDGQGDNHYAYRRGKSAATPSIINQWVYVTGVMRDAEDMDLYLNGEKLEGVYSGTSVLPMKSDAPEEVAKIGYWYSNDIVSHFNGAIDNLNIWNKALTDEEITDTMCKELKGNEEGLIGYWKFDEDSGLVIRDESSNKFNGTILGYEERLVLSSDSKTLLCD
jgi:hypothetical protein